MKEKVIIAWSGGKDSALALYELKRSGNWEVSTLLTTMTGDYNRTSMHGVRCVLLEQQASSMELALEKVIISKNASNEEYESKMRNLLEKYLAVGVTSVAFGDIFLEDLRKYREENLARIGMKGIFPIWKRNTVELAHTFINLGFEAGITCVDSTMLDKKFVGRLFNNQFLEELPLAVDLCGENGEFHSFVYDGPIFQKRILYRKGEVVLRENRFYYCDLLPGSV